MFTNLMNFEAMSRAVFDKDPAGGTLQSTSVAPFIFFYLLWGVLSNTTNLQRLNLQVGD